MTADDEQWAKAIAVERLHEDAAMAFATEHVFSRSAAGDTAGVQRWLLPSQRIESLQTGTRRQ